MSALPTPVYESEGVPLWQSVYSALTPGTNLNLSTLTIPLTGSINMEGTDEESAPIIFTQDPLPAEHITRKHLEDTYTNTQFNSLGVFVPEVEQGAPWTASELYLLGNQNTLIGNNTIASFLPDPGNEFGLLIGSGGTVRIDAPTNISTLEVSSINGQPWDPDFGVSKLIAGAGITLNPPTGVGQVTISATGSINSTFSTLVVSSISGNFARFSTMNAGRANISTLFVSTLVQTSGQASMNSTITNYISSGFGTFGTVAGGLISTSITTATQAILSSLQFNFNAGGFNPSLGGVNLGLGGFLGGLVGGIGSGIFNTILGGAALTTGIIALTNSRGNAPINSNLYEMVNTTTQLQFSTLGIPTLTYQRMSVPTPGALFSTFGREVIFSTLMPAGTTAVRSFSDPVNLAAPSSVTSTVQAFAPWAPLPIPTNFATGSISSLNVSSINGFPAGSGGGGGGGNFDPLSISTSLEWYQYSFQDGGFNPAFLVNYNNTSSFSTNYFAFYSGDKTGTKPGVSDEVDGIVNFNAGGAGFGFGHARLWTGDITLGSRSVDTQQSQNQEVLIRNNFSTVQNPSGVAQVEFARISTINNTTGAGNVLGYTDIIAGDFYASTNGVGLGGGNVFASGISTGGLALSGFVTTALQVQSNAIGQPGIINAPQASPPPPATPSNFHNIGGCLLGYYGTGTAFLSGGFQTGITALVFNGGVKMSNGYIFASPGLSVPDTYVGGSWFRTNGFATSMTRTGYNTFSNTNNGQVNVLNCVLDRACIVRLMASSEPGSSSYYTAVTAYVQNWNSPINSFAVSQITVDAASGGGLGFNFSVNGANPSSGTPIQLQVQNNTGVNGLTYSVGYSVIAFTGNPVI